jgi:1-acyl-sn-glycerol-3-phosphate acyltransferase
MSARVNRPLPLLVRRGLRPLLRAAFFLRGFRVEGAERLPRRRRRLIVIANHAAWIDSLYFLAAVRPRFTVCGAKPRYFATMGRRALMATLNILPVSDHQTFVADCTALLAANEITLIYPEMGRNAEGIGQFLTWAADVALASNAAILPCYIHGTTRGHTGPARLIVGHEIEPDGDAAMLTDRLFTCVTSLGGISGSGAAS